MEKRNWPMVNLSAEESDPVGERTVEHSCLENSMWGERAPRRQFSAARQSGKEALGVPVSLSLTGREEGR